MTYFWEQHVPNEIFSRNSWTTGDDEPIHLTLEHSRTEVPHCSWLYSV